MHAPRFTRVDPNTTVALRGSVWNELAACVEWLMRINAAPPLYIRDMNGPFLAVQTQASSPATLKIISAQAYASGATGAARYNAAIGVNAVCNLDPNSNFNPPDANMTFPVTANAIAVDVFEGGSSASGTDVIVAGSIVIGIRTGEGNETPPLPVYYFSSAPSGTLFKVLLVQNGGMQGNATTAAAWTYDLFLYDGTGLQLNVPGTPQSPDAPRPFGQLTAATIGWAYITPTGRIQLAEAIEPPITSQCTAATPSTYGASAVAQVSYGGL